MENSELTDHLTEMALEQEFEEVASELTMTQREKLAELAEDIEADDLETFVHKLKVIRDHHFGNGNSPSVNNRLHSEQDVFEGDPLNEQVVVDPSMQRYVKALERTIKI